MYQTAVHRSFRASHSLSGGPQQERVPHEHHFTLELVFAAMELDENGFVVDRTALEDCLAELLSSAERHLINDQPFFDDLPPTLENMARFFAEEIVNRLREEGLDAKRVARVDARLWESESSWASYSFEPGSPGPAPASPRRKAQARREPAKKPRK